MYKKETKDRSGEKVALFIVSNKSPNYGVFILPINQIKRICYQ